MRYSSSELLYELTTQLNPLRFIEVGSRDGLDSIKFAKSNPKAKILVFEPNPSSYKLTLSNLEGADIDFKLYPYAINEKPGSFKLYEYSRDNIGLSSLKFRKGMEPINSYDAECIRLDDFLIANDFLDKSVLWIDAEGAAFEVIKSVKNIRESICLIYVELENEEIFEKGKTRKNVKVLLKKMGFKEIHFTPHGKVNGKSLVGDSLFVSRKLLTVNMRFLILKYRFIFNFITFKIHLYENVILQNRWLNSIWNGFKTRQL